MSVPKRGCLLNIRPRTLWECPSSGVMGHSVRRLMMDPLLNSDWNLSLNRAGRGREAPVKPYRNTRSSQRVLTKRTCVANRKLCLTNRLVFIWPMARSTTQRSKSYMMDPLQWFRARCILSQSILQEVHISWCRDLFKKYVHDRFKRKIHLGYTQELADNSHLFIFSLIWIYLRSILMDDAKGFASFFMFTQIMVRV